MKMGPVQWTGSIFLVNVFCRSGFHPNTGNARLRANAFMPR